MCFNRSSVQACYRRRVIGPAERRLVLIGAASLLAGCLGPKEHRSALQIVTPVEGAARKSRVMFSYAHMNYDVPFSDITIREAQPVERPATIWLPGCGFSVQGAHTPRDEAIFSVDQDGLVSKEGTFVSACNARDGEALSKSARRNLKYIMEVVGHLKWVLHRSVVLIASGDAVPAAAAATSLSVSAKVLLSDPCYAAWPQNLDTHTPTYVLRSTDDYGLRFRETAPTTANIRSAALDDPNRLTGAIGSMIAERCAGQPRPRLPRNYVVQEASGEFSSTGRPTPLWSAQEQVYRLHQAR